MNLGIHISITCLLLSLAAASTTTEWQTWKLKYGKVYTNEKEEVYRRLIWERKLNYVRNHNNRSDKQFTVHMNQFADTEAIESTNLHLRQDTIKKNKHSMAGTAATSFDWRSRGVIGPVSEEGRDFNVKAIVASECVASLHAIHTGKLYLLSAREIDDCSCGMQLLIKDIFGCINRKIGGLCTNTSYNHIPQVCSKDGCPIVAKVNSTNFIPEGDEEEMGVAIHQTPLMVAIDASQPSFELYTSGIYRDNKCRPDRLSHILQLVGYGEENGKKYWICKNNWGVNWGINGYIWIERGTNMCGIAEFAIYPIL